MLEAVGLDPSWRRRYPHEFSGGQQQRIAIARAIAPRPRLLVGDEPVSALDVSVRVQILDLLRRLADEYELSLVLVSHDLGVVRYLCDDVLVLSDGLVVERGPPTRCSHSRRTRTPRRSCGPSPGSRPELSVATGPIGRLLRTRAEGFPYAGRHATARSRR